MNLHAAVRGVIQSVNPDTAGVYRRSSGFTTNAAGRQVPQYTDSPAQFQVQALTGRELRHEAFINQQGVKRAVYLFGNGQGVVRPDARGGDLLVFPQERGGVNRVWLVVVVLESWTPDPAGWCKLGVVLQDDTP